MKNKLIVLMSIFTLIIMSFATNIFAANTNEQKNKIENMVIGQITSVSKSEVIIKLAERNGFDKDNRPMRASFSNAFPKDMKPPKDFDNDSNKQKGNFKPPKDGNSKPPKDDNQGQNKKDNKDFKFDPTKMFTLKDETAKYDIKNATIVSGFGEEKTISYSDLKEGDYIEIETESKDSKMAKKVKKFE